MSSRHAPPEDASPRSRPALLDSLGVARRAAVALLTDPPPFELEATLAQWRDRPTDATLRDLAEDQVDQLVFHALRARDLGDRLPAAVMENLGNYARRRAATVLRQDHALREACTLLEENHLPHVFFKGALTRAILYTEPQHRPSADIDLVVVAQDVPRVTRLFSELGYQASLAAHSDTHELSLQRRDVQLDLHWSLTRPGRMRRDIAGAMIASRIRYGELWGPSPDYLTVALLVHPAITDHVTARLISAVDLDRWLRTRSIGWPDVIAILDRIGLRSAAWAMLFWTQALFATPIPESVWDGLAISPLRQRYLASWLVRDPARLYHRRPFLVRTAFSLPLQDRASDVVRALWRMAYKERMSI